MPSPHVLGCDRPGVANFRLASGLVKTALLSIFAVLGSRSLATAQTATVSTPRLFIDGWRLELIATEPGLVTPTGCCFDSRGRLYVIECHTHFPPEDYAGPKQDRIYRFDDSDGDGVVDRKQLFYEGGSASMGIAALPDDSLVVASRSEVVRLRDEDGDQPGDRRTVLLTLETAANYPHNGLTGVVLGPDGWLYVGQGENLGEAYSLIALDGSRQSGGGEGGNVFRCRPDGSRLQRVATGFWNPFHLAFDAAGRLWTVGNDPDAMPPCRLLQVVQAGDYGFQFRFGRAGTHPLQAWDGELPGTLPMTAGTGEAPCAVLPYGPHLWVTSWGDNRIERYPMRAQGATWQSETEVVVQGDAHFRPVGMAVAPDGSIYITDWADRSYPVHGKGRLWRLSRTAPVSATGQARFAELAAPEARARRLQNEPSLTAGERLAALDQPDPFIHQAAVAGLVQHDQLRSLPMKQATTPRQRIGLLTAWRWLELTAPDQVSAPQRAALLSEAFEDASPDVVLVAIRWATEAGLQEFLPRIRQRLEQPALSARDFSAVMASIAYLETGSAARGKRDPAREQRVLAFAADPTKTPGLRAIAVGLLPSDGEQPSAEQLGTWLREQPDRSFGIAVVRLLAARDSDAARDQLAAVATETTIDIQTRADAMAGLARHAGKYASVLNRLALPRQPEGLRAEALRVLQRTRPNRSVTKPSRDDLEAWNGLLAQGGDRDAGRRVFFRTTCANCHAYQGRGALTGPDLSTLSGQMTRQRLLESILQPSKEIGPLYVPWQVLTVDGQVLTGLKLDRAGAGNAVRFQGADGMLFEVPLEAIESQAPVAKSIMPSGLEEGLSIEEMRDLVAFLTAS